MNEGNILAGLKGAAWERAKGELASLGHMSYGPNRADEYNIWQKKCEKRRELIEGFIKAMEDEELYYA